MIYDELKRRIDAIDRLKGKVDTQMGISYKSLVENHNVPVESIKFIKEAVDSRVYKYKKMIDDIEQGGEIPNESDMR